jgi:purine-nucleoside phosphorylase
VREDFSIRVRRAAESVRMSTELSPSVGLVLGSGLAGVADAIPGTEVSFAQIEGFPLPTVTGHRGVLKLNGAVAVLAGRFHYYEGHTMDNVVLPVFLLHALGVRTLIVTNAAGGINRDFSPGDIVFISDHINLMGTNPLIGPNDADLGPRFADMSRLYSPELRRAVRSRVGRKSKEGVYAGLTGPSYETPAEIRMSTVPEAIGAGYLGMNVLGISCITNMAAGILDRRLDHAEVVATGKQVEGEMTRIILLALETLAGLVA